MIWCVDGVYIRCASKSGAKVMAAQLGVKRTWIIAPATEVPARVHEAEFQVAGEDGILDLSHRLEEGTRKCI